MTGSADIPGAGLHHGYQPPAPQLLGGALWDFDVEGARLRFDAIQGALDQRRKGCSISVGFAELQSDDTLHDLTARGDAALYEEKHRKQEEKSADGRPRPTA